MIVSIASCRLLIDLSFKATVILYLDFTSTCLYTGLFLSFLPSTNMRSAAPTPPMELEIIGLVDLTLLCSFNFPCTHPLHDSKQIDFHRSMSLADISQSLFVPRNLVISLGWAWLRRWCNSSTLFLPLILYFLDHRIY